MFFRIHKLRRNGKEYHYLKLVENYRIEGKTRQRVVVNFGSVTNLDRDRLRELTRSLSGLHNGRLKSLRNTQGIYSINGIHNGRKKVKK